MQDPLKEMALALMTQVDSLIKTAEIMEPQALFKLEGVAERAGLVMEKYVNTCSEVQGQLQNVLQRVRGRFPDTVLEAKLTQAIARLEELKKPYVSGESGDEGTRGNA